MDHFPLMTAAISAGTVALAEIGDKTQLLALLLAARFRKPLPIIAGILVATLLNHALAGWFGTLVAQWLTPEVLRWVVAASFFAVALWTLKPDTLDEGEESLPARGAFIATTFAFFLAEIGDKTQLLALLLAARFRKPLPIIAGILVATLLNHALAGWFGTLVAQWLTPDVLRWVVAISFLAVAIWTLKPDKLDEGEESLPARGAFVATTFAFFLAEIGDKTQVATVLLAAKYSPLWEVVVGTTVGMLLANVPVVLLGSKLADRLPLKAARYTAAVVFLVLAIWAAVRGIG